MDAADVAGDIVHVGTPPGPLSDWVIKKVHFHGFEGLPTTRGEEVKSPKFSCFGHQWTVAIYPGGVKVSNEGGVAIFLVSESPESIQADYKIVMKHPIDQAKKTYGEAAGRHVEEDQMPSDGPPLRHHPAQHDGGSILPREEAPEDVARGLSRRRRADRQLDDATRVTPVGLPGPVPKPSVVVVSAAARRASGRRRARGGAGGGLLLRRMTDGDDNYSERE